MGERSTYEPVQAEYIMRIKMSDTSEPQTHMDELQQQREYILLFNRVVSGHYIQTVLRQ